MTWWENAEQGRAGRYGDPADLDDRPTRAECDADERELAALRSLPPVERDLDIIADLIAAVDKAKTERLTTYRRVSSFVINGASAEANTPDAVRGRAFAWHRAQVDPPILLMDY